MNEAETRAEHIDPALAVAGWGVVENSRVRRQYAITPGRLEGRGLFGKLPEFFKDEAELRALWSAPETRKKLLQGLAEKGFGGEQLAEMQRITTPSPTSWPIWASRTRLDGSSQASRSTCINNRPPHDMQEQLSNREDRSRNVVAIAPSSAMGLTSLPNGKTLDKHS